MEQIDRIIATFAQMEDAAKRAADFIRQMEPTLRELAERLAPKRQLSRSRRKW